MNYFIDTCSSVCDSYLNRLHYQPSGYLLCPPAVPLCLSALSRFSLLCPSCCSPPLVTVRYQKTDGRFGTTSFNHASLADGRDHHVMLHASGLQRGPPRLNIYIDCRLVHTLNDLPAAFGSLPPGPNKVALRTLQSSGQVNKTFTAESNSKFDYSICCIETKRVMSQHYSVMYLGSAIIAFHSNDFISLSSFPF